MTRRRKPYHNLSGEQENKIMDWDKFWGLFHNAWGQAKESTEYDKEVFNNMQGMLQNVEENRNSDGVKMVIIPERRKEERRINAD